MSLIYSLLKGGQIMSYAADAKKRYDAEIAAGKKPGWLQRFKGIKFVVPLGDGRLHISPEDVSMPILERLSTAMDNEASIEAGVDELKKMKSEAAIAALNTSLIDVIAGKAPIEGHMIKLKDHIKGGGPER